jgi:hypothetical protein
MNSNTAIVFLVGIFSWIAYGVLWLVNQNAENVRSNERRLVRDQLDHLENLAEIAAKSGSVVTLNKT